MFDVNEASVSSQCGNCGGTIPPRTKKLRFQKFLGLASVNESLCRNCFIEIAQKMLGYATTLGSRILHVIVEEDAQALAEKIIGRQLNEDELYSVKKGLEHGLSDYWICLETAIRDLTGETWLASEDEGVERNA